ncbi:MAG: integrase arm-type DNA-binding domain-containing protein [Sphingobium sp.]|nr:integrase arm-type DNA-binding domain-containing protein [Sphingobium sp.]
MSGGFSSSSHQPACAPGACAIVSADGKSCSSLGQWPDVQLVDARDRAEEARGLVAQGVDPSVRANLHMQIRTFESVAREWHHMQRGRWTDRHARRRDRVAGEQRVIGYRAAADRRDRRAGECCSVRDVEARGSIETARRIRQRISAVFSFRDRRGTSRS